MRVLMVAPPYAGHLNPLLVIGRHLAARGDRVHVVTGPDKVAACHDLGLEATAALAGDPDALERLADTESRVWGDPVRLIRQVRANFQALETAQADLTRVADRFEPDVVIGDFCAPIAGVAAKQHRVPWVTTIPTPFAIENRRGTPAYLGGWRPPRTPAGHLRDAVARAGTRSAKHLAGTLFRGSLRAFGGSLYRPDGTEAFYSDQAIWALGVRALEFERDWPASLRFIGPITAVPGAAPAVVLPDCPRPRVLVTLGTHLPWAKRGLPDAAVSLGRRRPDLDFVVSLGNTTGSTVPRRLAPNVQLVDWLPYDQMMDAFAAVLHHGGAGITYSALRRGLPSVVWPHDYDQFDFAARLVHGGLGVRIRSADQAAAALTQAFALPREPLLTMAAALAVSDPLAAATRHLDALVAR